MKYSQVELQVLINGVPVKEYGHKGISYIEGRTNTEFTLRIKNNSPNRILAIPSIDGLSVMDGEDASSKSSGYIISAYSSYEIKGWRTSLKEVSKFVFAKKGNSLSNQTGHGTKECGVIGCVIFGETPKLTYTVYTNSSWPDMFKRGLTNPGFYDNTYDVYSSNMSLNSKSLKNTVPFDISTTRCSYNSVTPTSIPINDTPNFKLGTDYGESMDDKVVESDFDKGSLLCTFELHYTTKYELEQIGIDIEKKNNKVYIPSAFSDRKFCKLPKRN